MRVQASLSGGSANLSDQPVVFGGASWDPLMRLEGSNEDWQIGVDYALEFDLLIPSSSLTAGGVVTVLLDENLGNHLGNLTLQTANYRAVIISNGFGVGAGPTESVTVYNAWSADKVMHVVLAMDAARDEIVVFIDNTLIGSVPIAAAANYHVVKNVVFQTGGNVGNVFGLDDIVSSSDIPEVVYTEAQFPAWGC